MTPSAGPRLGVLLVNLGSPQAPTRTEVRRFLREFLLDSRVVELPRALWWPLLNGVVIPLRAGRVARAYEAIWTETGSPLRCYTQRLAERLERQLAEVAPIVVRWAVTYGSPGIAAQLRSLQAAAVDTIVVVPLFPQYSATTTAAVYDRIADLIKQTRDIPDLRIVKSYANFSGYISALAESVRAHWAKYPRGERLLISFHGIPQACADRGDPYPEQCLTTANLLVKALGLRSHEWQLTYQSRFGRQQWLQPYTDETLVEWAREGVAAVDVICPAFATDCLETLEEIGKENAALFCQSGGITLRLIPCLNDSEWHASMLKSLVLRQMPEISLQ